MKKKSIIKFILATIIILLGFLIYNIVTKTKAKNKIAQQLQNIPEFKLLTFSKNIFTNANIKPNLNTIFIYFNSECDFCQHEAQSISDSIDKFNDVQLVFVSTETIEKIKAFSEQYNLNNKENVVFLHDAKDEFSKTFNASSIPFTLIYNEQQQLIKTHKGQLNAVGILRIINEQ